MVPTGSHITVQTEESLEKMSDRIAIFHNISTSTLRNLVWSESRWNPNATSTTGDRGILQINKEYWPDITDEQAFDPEFSLNFAAEKISQGKENLWTACNCYSLVKTRVNNLPRMKDITPNSTLGRGVVAILDYSGTKHVAVVESVDSDSFVVFEANYTPCMIGRRTVRKDDPQIVGFYRNNAQTRI